MTDISEVRKTVISMLHPDERQFLRKICLELEKRNFDLPVLYAGSGGDVEHAVLLGNRLVFVDSHLPEVTISEIKNNIARIGGEINQEKKRGVLGQGGKHIIEFEICKEEFELTYYAEDATRISGIRELRNGYSVYFVKVPLPKEAKVGSLSSPDSLADALKNLVTGGYYLERECPLVYFLKPEILGFRKVASGYISALSIYSKNGNLYRKIREVEDIKSLLLKDRLMLDFEKKDCLFQQSY